MMTADTKPRFIWVAEVLDRLCQAGKSGLVMEVKLKGQSALVNVIDRVPLAEFERSYKIDPKRFRGRIEYHCGGSSGTGTVKILASLTEDEFRESRNLGLTGILPSL